MFSDRSAEVKVKTKGSVMFGKGFQENVLHMRLARSDAYTQSVSLAEQPYKMNDIFLCEMYFYAGTRGAKCATTYAWNCKHNKTSRAYVSSKNNCFSFQPREKHIHLLAPFYLHRTLVIP